MPTYLGYPADAYQRACVFDQAELAAVETFNRVFRCASLLPLQERRASVVLLVGFGPEFLVRPFPARVRCHVLKRVGVLLHGAPYVFLVGLVRGVFSTPVGQGFADQPVFVPGFKAPAAPTKHCSHAYSPFPFPTNECDHCITPRGGC